MQFREAESYLLSLGNEVEAMKLGLENIRALLGALGDPQNKYYKVQVAGTNGKGSVCAFLDSICREAGVNTGLYTSPHLVSMTERIKIGGRDIDESGFARLATQVRGTAEDLLADGVLTYRPTYFEQVTAIALAAFADAGVELAILETGLGGRLDATTAATAEIAVITRIDLDHQQYLGETIEEIAAEKAAIIHSGSKVVIGEQPPEAMRVIIERCKRLNIGGNTSREVCASDTKHTHSLPLVFPPVSLGLAGRHQIENAKTAILAAEALRDHFSISERAIADGLANARHPGRLELIGNVLLDGAHNASGARALRTYLDEFVQKPVTLVYGSMKDKDIGAIASILFPAADKLILTSAENSRSATPNDLLPFADGRDDVYTAGNIALALEIAAKFRDNLICVTGSLYLVGEARKILLRISTKGERKK